MDSFSARDAERFPCQRRLLLEIVEKESQHFAGGIRAVRICVGAICAAPGPGMTTSVDKPMLHQLFEREWPWTCLTLTSSANSQARFA
jgi:hypothetical protein